MFSVIYEVSGHIYQIGPFDTRLEADNAARQAHREGEVNIRNTRLYLLTDTHEMIEYTERDLL